MQRSGRSDGNVEDHESRAARVLAAARRVMEERPVQVDWEELSGLARQLIAIYNSYCPVRELSIQAVEMLARLSQHYDKVLDLVIEDAKQYARNQHIDDAFPYNPNGFDVLEKIGAGHDRVIAFLEETVREDWCIPRWNAIEVLCRLRDPAADCIVQRVVQGQYPPKNDQLASDLRIIEQIRGADFISQKTSKKE